VSEKYLEIGRKILALAFASADLRGLKIRFWDGSEWTPKKTAKVRVTITLNHAGSLRRMFLPPGELSLGEAFIYGDFDLDGERDVIFEMAQRLGAPNWSIATKGKNLKLLMQLPRRKAPIDYKYAAKKKSGRLHSKARDRDSVAFAYDVSNDFFALFIDKRMVYTCAYFKTKSDSLEQAQLQKLELICRKLNLQKGDKLFDLGCGWGALSIYAAKNYGVQTHGVTLSAEQGKEAIARIKKEGLSKMCKVEVKDYRDVPPIGQFDKVAAIGMMEHIGESELNSFYAHMWGLLEPGGMLLSHGIATNGAENTMASPFTQKYIFPDGQAVNAAARATAAIHAGFEVRDIENLREHYVLTSLYWLKGLERNKKKIIAMRDETFYKIAWIAMAGAHYRFKSGSNGLIQDLYYKPDPTGKITPPLNREGWYK
jgi:cyclopropane-fatty-acyl-phospholipid synthase